MYIEKFPAETFGISLVGLLAVSLVILYMSWPFAVASLTAMATKSYHRTGGFRVS